MRKLTVVVLLSNTLPTAMLDASNLSFTSGSEVPSPALYSTNAQSDSSFGFADSFHDNSVAPSLVPRDCQSFVTLDDTKIEFHLPSFHLMSRSEYRFTILPPSPQDTILSFDLRFNDQGNYSNPTDGPIHQIKPKSKRYTPSNLFKD